MGPSLLAPAGGWLPTFHLPPTGALCEYPELSYWPLKKCDEQTETGNDDDDEGAFNID